MQSENSLNIHHWAAELVDAQILYSSYICGGEYVESQFLTWYKMYVQLYL